MTSNTVPVLLTLPADNVTIEGVSDRRIAVAAAAVAAGMTGAVGAAVAADRRWRRADEVATGEAHDGFALPEGREAKVDRDDGAVLAVTDAGDGPAVVLAHCWTGQRATWAPVAHRLVQRGHRVVLYDQRGHGGSTVGDDGCTIEAIGDDLAAVLDELDVRDAVLAGHSMGGMAVQSFVARHPTTATARARRLVLVATAAGGLPSARAGALGAAAVAAPVLDRVMRSRAGHAFVRSSVGARPRYSHLAATRDWFAATGPGVRRDFLTAMHAMDLHEGLAAIPLPTTVVCGTRDRLTPLPLARRLAARVPGATIVELEGVGHMVPLEAPDRLAEVLTEEDTA